MKLLDLYGALKRLHGFRSLNRIAVVKIVKVRLQRVLTFACCVQKLDKRIGASDESGLFLKAHLSESEFCPDFALLRALERSVVTSSFCVKCL